MNNIRKVIYPSCYKLVLNHGKNFVILQSRSTSSGSNSSSTSGRTPTGKLDENKIKESHHPYQEKEPLQPFPENTNPKTGEIGGPKGPEPTRYGDWERKGRVSDF